MLKLIEEPPPHLVFVFCTTDLSKVLPTVRSRCQTFVFQRPRLQDLVTVLSRVAQGEAIDAPPQALSLIARAARGSFRDATSTLDQLASATGKEITVQSVLQLLGTVEEDALFRLCDLVVDRDTAGALTFIEELSEQGHDLGRLVSDLIEHLRHLMLVQHMDEVPESLPVTEETHERLRAQANQLGEPTVVRLIDLLAVAVDDMRQGGDPRLPLELALVKVTRPAADLSRESIAYRLEQLETRGARPCSRRQPCPRCRTRGRGRARRGSREGARPRRRAARRRARAAAGGVGAHDRSRGRGEVDPDLDRARRGAAAELDGDTLTIEFPATASFHRQLAEEPKNTPLLRDALYEVTGRKLALTFAVGEGEDGEDAEPEGPAGEEHSSS